MKEYVSVAVSGPGMDMEKFLGVKAVDEGTGVMVSDAAKGFLTAWGINPNAVGPDAVGLTYDTCSVNTGRDRGKKLVLIVTYVSVIG